MTDSQKLQAVITYAIGRGWDGMDTKHHGQKIWKIIQPIGDNQPAIYSEVKNMPGYYEQRPAELLFDNSFAKAVWGEENFYSPEVVIPRWQYHLQQAVVSDNPIDYYWRQINE